MYKNIDQPVKVGVKFTDGKAEPVWFFWKNRKYTIEEINLYHRTFEGEAPVHHFSVTTKGGVYKLSFDGKKLNWNLDELWME